MSRGLQSSRRDEHLANEQVVHNKLYRIVQDEHFGPVRVVRYPTMFDGHTIGTQLANCAEDHIAASACAAQLD